MTESTILKDLVRHVRLGELVRSRAGKTPSRRNPAYWGGSVPWVTAKDLKTHHLGSSQEQITPLSVRDGAPIAIAGDVLILVRGMTLLNDVPVGLAGTRMSYNQDVRRLRPIDGVSGEYLSYLLSAARSRLLSAVTIAGHGTGRLDVDQLLATRLPIPSAEVQRWLIQRLHLIELGSIHFSELYHKKQTLLRSLRCHLLTGRRRFPEFASSDSRCQTPFGTIPQQWDVVPLARLAEPVTRKYGSAEAPVLTCSGEFGLIDQRDFFSKRVASESLVHYTLLHRGEFAYNRSAMKGYPYGAIKRLNRYEAGALSTLNVCFRITGEGINSDFVLHLFESGLLNRQLIRIARVGSRAHGLLNISKQDFFRIHVPVPSSAEQRRIADLLDAGDREIKLLEMLRTQYELQKRGLMQRLLSGEISVPLPVSGEESHV